MRDFGEENWRAFSNTLFLSLNVLYKQYNIQFSLILALFVTFYFLNSGSKANVLN